MAAKTSKTTEVFTVHSRRAPGCVFIGFVVLGIICIAIAVGISYIGYTEDGSQFTKLFGPMLGLWGIIAVYAGFRSPARAFHEDIEFDIKLDELRFAVSSLGGDHYRVPLSQISHLHLLKTRKMQTGSSSSTSSRFIYQIYVVKKDGAELWIVQHYNPSQILEVARDLADFTGLEVQDSAGTGFSVAAAKTYTDTYATPPPKSKSQLFVTEVASADSVTYGIKLPFAGGKGLIVAAVLAIFIIAPVLILTQVAEGEAPGFFMVVVIIFCAIFYGIIIMVIIAQLKIIELVTKPTGFSVKLRYRVKALNSILSKDLEISKSQIRSVRLNRGEEGHFYLALGVGADAAIGNSARFLMNMGNIRSANLAREIRPDETTVKLWETSIWQKASTGATVFDLAYLEEKLQRTIGLDDMKPT